MTLERNVAFQPLLDYLRRLAAGPAPGEEWTQVNIARLCGVSKQAVNQWTQRGIDPWRADQIAVRALKTLPWVIWGPSWERACEIDEQLRETELRKTIDRPWRWPDGRTETLEAA